MSHPMPDKPTKQMTSKQRELARHALGFPNKSRTSYRNHFCAGVGHPDYGEWESMVAQGYAIKRTSAVWGDIFYLTLTGANLARNAKEHLSEEDAAWMQP